MTISVTEHRTLGVAPANGSRRPTFATGEGHSQSARVWRGSGTQLAPGQPAACRWAGGNVHLSDDVVASDGYDGAPGRFAQPRLACAPAIGAENLVTLERMFSVLRATAQCAAAAALVLAAGLLADVARAQAPQAREQGQGRADVDAESVSRRQPLLLERALAGLQGTRADDPPRLFFVGFAGYGPEAVFKREVLAVRALFDARFGTGGRSLVLVNHATTLDAIALASPANLDRALHHIGGLMSRNKDVLFLFLTSHGRKDLLAVEMPGFGLDDLTPASLKAMLDRSGIKNRVIVLSACHSGSFVPALADPTTLVMTAAHADRTSFGCEDRREWTYFGDAFFNRALRRESSFERAFDRARRLISRWEKTERLEQSLPQIAGGDGLRQRIEEIAGRTMAQK